ncbi:NAD-dependent epimerase/dehydratase family protein [Streptomyces sp. NPDC056690]|uniref:NAD-dependent epimerase/dehydratase family protein n=1 Tax=Streptomyces sp. NPDC056690 TaxID=3345912 RepID=UPI00369F5C1F
MTTWLITGGAGYIGAHVARAMAEAGERVVVFDDLSTGIPERLPREIPLVEGSTLDRAALDAAITEHGVTGIVHLAAKKQVPESVAQPLFYYRENLQGLEVLLGASAAAGVQHFVFSSSAAVYGMPDVDLVTEDTPCVPINPYGETKLAGEWLVRAVRRRRDDHLCVGGLAPPPRWSLTAGRSSAGAAARRGTGGRPWAGGAGAQSFNA